jgi:hypothetical protein
MENHLKRPNAIPKWGKTKKLMCTYPIEAWDKKVRTRGKHLCWLRKRVDKLAEDLYFMQLNHPYYQKILGTKL